MSEIVFTSEAINDLKRLKKIERRTIIGTVELQLTHQPVEETRNRKRLRPNDLAEWELRIGKFRVSYDVDQEEKVVKMRPLGIKKGIPFLSTVRSLSYENHIRFKKSKKHC